MPPRAHYFEILSLFMRKLCVKYVAQGESGYVCVRFTLVFARTGESREPRSQELSQDFSEVLGTGVAGSVLVVVSVERLEDDVERAAGGRSGRDGERAAVDHWSNDREISDARRGRKRDGMARNATIR